MEKDYQQVKENILNSPNSNKGVRLSNIELCRMYSMFLIVLLHSTWVSIGYPHFLGFNTFLVSLIYSLSIVGIDVFLLITGWFSINLKKKSVLSLVWILLFYGIIRLGLHLYNNDFRLEQLLFISKSNWFIVSYIGLMTLSPILNKSVIVSKQTLGGTIFVFLLYGIWFNIFPAKASISPGFNNGASVIWFVEMYLIGRYLRLYDCLGWIKKYSLLVYLLQVLIVMAMTVLSLYFIHDERISKVIGLIGAQNNPIIVVGAIAVFYTFKKIKIQSRFINHLAKSTLAVLLVHTTIINTQMKEFFSSLFNTITGVYLVIIWILGAVAIYMISVLIDQLRIIIFEKIRIINDKSYGIQNSSF